ncbi:hypothetical protein GCM10023320_34380 [Pseudonocardia adelaidensis]|uniref:Uncharacterized protein n=1 Tax=Pseudonocardia adelaidensis TaxID=648754 RepID=A0ABP9NN05_9PSEU
MADADAWLPSAKALADTATPPPPIPPPPEPDARAQAYDPVSGSRAEAEREAEYEWLQLVPLVPMHDADACAEFASPAAAAVVMTWPPPMVPFPKPTASALAPGADAWLSAR